MKKCRVCTQLKDLTDFPIRKDSKDGRRNSCSDCNKLSHKAIYAGKAELRKSQVRQHYADNRYKVLAQKKEYYHANAQTIKSKIVEKRQTDLQARLRHRLRTRLNKALKKSFKSGSAVSDLGCSIEQFKIHLESLFKPGMTWENLGQWHVDHKYPLAAFDLTDRSQFLRAAHFTNLQPLWASDNISKGCKVI